MWARMAPVFEGKEDAYFSEEILLKADGSEHHVILQLVSLDPVGRYSNQFLCQIVDISDRKAAEGELLVRNMELNNFMYKVSHDLRSPLLTIKGLINLLRLEKDKDVLDNYIGMIESRVNKLDGFIRDILSHSKNLNTEITIAPVDVRALVERSFSRMSAHVNFNIIERKIKIVGKPLHSDETRLDEIMRNLVANAILYSCPERNRSFIKVSLETTDTECVIIVEDNGIGIKKEYIDKIFQMFYRANEKVEGSGIGLYIVHQAITKLGGQVKVKSKLNVGTTFTLTIPNKI